MKLLAQSILFLYVCYRTCMDIGISVFHLPFIFCS